MKRRELLKLLAAEAKRQGVQMQVIEGAGHSKVVIGENITTVPRHRELNELTAKAILKQMGVGR